MDKRKIGIGIAIAAGIVLLFFIGKMFTGRPSTSGPPSAEKGGDEDTEKIAQAQAAVHELCRYADSIGIDTTRYSLSSVSRLAEINAKRNNVLLEIRYGKKPSRLAFSGLKENVDSAWAGTADGQSASVAKLNTFAPYQQLVSHYNRIRRAGGSSPATVDSLRLLRQTLNFYRYINRFDGEQFVVVNIPAAELNVFDRKGARLLPMNVIVGKPDRQTPSMTTFIQNVVAYPYWNVPRKIALEEVLPRAQKNIAYVHNQNFQILDEKEQEVDPDEIDWSSLSATNFPYRVRQASGCENSLGLLKFDLANPLAIYLHDTNSRDLFTQTANRWRSHGCVRVQKPVELANLVLGAQTFTPDFMNKCLIDQKPRQLATPRKFPVFIAYNVADVDAGGKLKFYKDVYSLDR